MSRTVNLESLMKEFTYRDENRVKRDVYDVSRRVRTLVPKKGLLVLNTGKEKELLALEGTVVIWYKEAQYNIPIEMFVVPQYPSTPPMVYVRPTLDMEVKPGHRHVDSAGLVYLPYLHEWNAATHNLVKLCETISSVFGVDPPVFAKQKGRPVSFQPKVEESPVERAQREVTVKLQQELQVVYGELRKGIDHEFDVQYELQESGVAIEEEKALFDKERSRFEKLVTLVGDRNLELSHLLEQKKEKGDPDPGDLVDAQDVLSRQMLGLVAENAAIEDLLYFLDQGLAEQRIPLDEFLREIRKVGRKQFMARALIMKIHKLQFDHLPPPEPGAWQQQQQHQQHQPHHGAAYNQVFEPCSCFMLVHCCWPMALHSCTPALLSLLPFLSICASTFSMRLLHLRRIRNRHIRSRRTRNRHRSNGRQWVERQCQRQHQHHPTSSSGRGDGMGSPSCLCLS
ncbi:unnamed protein product [Chrysoparadoxa australica]